MTPLPHRTHVDNIELLAPLPSMGVLSMGFEHCHTGNILKSELLYTQYSFQVHTFSHEKAERDTRTHTDGTDLYPQPLTWDGIRIEYQYPTIYENLLLICEEQCSLNCFICVGR